MPGETEADARAAVAAIQATENVATAADHAAISGQIIDEKLTAAGLTRAELQAVLEALLAESEPAITFFETYALDPSMSSPQWTAFQALDQTTKDRILFDLTRSVAALMRYLSGHLQVPPT